MLCWPLWISLSTHLTLFSLCTRLFETWICRAQLWWAVTQYRNTLHYSPRNWFRRQSSLSSLQISWNQDPIIQYLSFGFLCPLYPNLLHQDHLQLWTGCMLLSADMDMNREIVVAVYSWLIIILQWWTKITSRSSGLCYPLMLDVERAEVIIFPTLSFLTRNLSPSLRKGCFFGHSHVRIKMLMNLPSGKLT